jgi:hypothetical protein
MTLTKDCIVDSIYENTDLQRLEATRETGERGRVRNAARTTSR